MTREKETRKIDDAAKFGVHQLTEMHEKLILKAWADPEFKKELIANPAKAVEKALGIKVPTFLTLMVIEETADTRYITLPYLAQSGDRPLNENELEKVAGGSSSAALPEAGYVPGCV